MRFVCDSCRAQYMISDDKVGAKGVKVRCKKCGYVILVRRPDAGAASSVPVLMPAGEGIPPAAPEGDAHAGPANGANGTHGASANGAAQANGAAENNALAGLQDDEIGAVFDQVLKSGPHKIDQTGKNGVINTLAPPPENEDLSLNMGDNDAATTRVVSVDELKRLAEKAEATGSGNGAEASKVPLTDWFVAIDDAQTGPLTLEKIKDLWDRGEIGPDSLCWRAGFSDWMPVSEVTDLAAVLAPKPAKPMIVPGTHGNMMTVPVETTFNSGGISQTVRTNVPVSMGASSDAAGDTGGWKPSAASALASLASEEMSALAKPKPTRSLLETGPHEIPSIRHTPSHAQPQVAGLLDIPVAGESGRNPVPPTVHPQQQNGHSGYGSHYAAYSAPPPIQRGMSTGAKIGIAGGLFAMVAMAGVVVFVVTRPQPAALPPQQQLAQVAPTQQQPTPSVANPVTPPAAQPATTEPSTGATSLPMPPPPAVAAKDPVKPPPTGANGPVVPATFKPSTGGTKTRPPRGDGDGDVITSGPSKPLATPSGGDDEFEREFGGGGDAKKKPAAAEPEKKRSGSVYIPPAVGSADANVPDSLGQSDIMQVVLGNKSAIVTCVNEQKAKQPGLSGTLVMRWTIQTTGKTTGVSAQTEEFKSTPMATCIGGLIRSWKFPKHKTQGDPINFPFKF
jgi:predicted Zn finger-like uncharacterized protein